MDKGAGCLRVFGAFFLGMFKMFSFLLFGGSGFVLDGAGRLIRNIHKATMK
jgi:hypothetical protein